MGGVQKNSRVKSKFVGHPIDGGKAGQPILDHLPTKEMRGGTATKRTPSARSARGFARSCCLSFGLSVGRRGVGGWIVARPGPYGT